MIERFFLQDYLSFDIIDLEFENGLVVFSGPSGAGKSIFFNAMVSLFGLGDASPRIAEALLDNEIVSDDFIVEDMLVLKLIKGTKTRYNLNNQIISKSKLQALTSSFFKHLHLKDTSDFDNEKILTFLDFLGSKQIEGFISVKEKFKEQYIQLNTLEKELNKILEDEKNIEELKNFCIFEIEQITTIDPKENEYEELKAFKELFSKKEKLENALKDAKPFIDNSYKVGNALKVLEIDSAFFDDAINEVTNYFEKFYDELSSLDDMDLDKTMGRLDELQKLIKRYGSLEDAIEYKKNKEKELENYENITFEKAILEKNIKNLRIQVNEDAETLSKYRASIIINIEEEINKVLEDLYLTNLSMVQEKKSLDIYGTDLITLQMNNTKLEKLSSGEFNRLRLAWLSVRSFYETSHNGILFLDEIDANLSGKESESIGKVLQQLAKHYQIFAVSHQPQLSSLAKQHFLVEKNDEVSTIKEIRGEDRVKEISRMISGENVSKEAVEFARKLLN